MKLKRFMLPAVAVFGSLAVIWTVFGPVAAQDKKDVPAPPAAKWEYKVIRPEPNRRSIAEDKMEAALNKLGEEGWECVGTVGEVTGGEPQGTLTKAVLILKRPKR
jgi:hypothetical protein